MLEELCRQIGITDPQEMQEFALFLIKKEGEPLAWGEIGGGGRLDSRRWLTCQLCARERGRFPRWGWQACGQG